MSPLRLALATLALAAAAAPAARAQNTVSLDLQTAGQWNANFRRLANISGGAAAQTTVGSAGLFRFDANTTNTSPAISHAAYLYDTTPADATLATQSTFDTTAPVTVALDVRSTNAASVALIFADAENPSNNVLALFDLKTGNDTVRFYKDGSRNSAGTTFSVGTQVGSTSSLATTAEPGVGAAFTNFAVTLDRSGSTPTLLVEVEGVANPITYTFYKGNIDWARTTVILRIDDGGGATVGSTPVDLDNIIIQSGAAPASPVTANTPPRLEGSSARTIAAGRLLVVGNPAVDFDVPRQTLTYALTQAPAGASIDAEGTILWRPGAAAVSATPYTFTTVVSDNGSPARTATNTFDVTVTSAVSLGAFTRDLDFLAADQFDALFRSVTDVGGGTLGQVGELLVMDATSNGGNQSQAWLFDTTPADPTAATQTTFPVASPLTVSFQARVRASDSSLAVLFADSRNALNNVSAVLNLRNGADLLRFFRDGSLTRRSTTAGTQVGPDNVLTTAAEPLYPEYLPVTVTLSASGSTPTLSVKVGDAAPIVSAFAAGDLNWTTTLVLLRLNDANSATNTALQLNNLVVGGATPVTPVPPVYTAAPGANGNLLTTNPSFESGSLSNYSGTYTLPGWDGRNEGFSQHSLVSGSVAAGTTTDGVKKIRQLIGGDLVTAVSARAAAAGGTTYEFAFDQSIIRRSFPNEKLGTFRFIEFFDSAGVRIQQAFGTDSDYKVAFDGPLNTWATWTLRAVAPAGTASVGVRIENPKGAQAGPPPNLYDRDLEIDQVRLTVVADAAERIAVRRAPRLVEPGQVASLRLHSLALSPRTLRASLVDSANTIRATASVAVSAGRFRGIPLDIAIPSSLTSGTYSWRFELLPTGGGAAVATFNRPGVLVDQSVALSPLNATDFPADHPRIQYMGRIEEQAGGSRRLHWFGSELRVRFSGTSLSMVGATSDNGFGVYDKSWSFLVAVDGDVANPISITMSPTASTVTKTLVSGLPDGIHTLRLLKSAESNLRLRIDTLRTDPGRGLLVPEPASPRKLEVFGDSVTSGSSATPAFFAYAPYLGSYLDAQVHVVSVSGTGVAASFSGQSLLGQYFDNLELPNGFSGNQGTPWDFSRYTPDAVLIGIGHNDQFNGGAGTPFNTKYAEFKGQLRAVYPGVKIFSYNTTISANLGHFQGALLPLTATDPDHRFAFQPNVWSDSNTVHPPTDSHIAMVAGDERRFSMAEIVEDMLGWGLDSNAPVNLLPNAGFESGLSGWTNYNNATSLVTDRVEGAQAARVGLGAGGVARFVNLPAGTTTVRLSFQAKATTNQANSVNLKFLNASFVQVGSTVSRNVFGSATAPWASDATPITTVPATATQVEVSTWSPANNYFYLDDLVLEANP